MSGEGAKAAGGIGAEGHCSGGGSAGSAGGGVLVCVESGRPAFASNSIKLVFSGRSVQIWSRARADLALPRDRAGEISNIMT